MELNGEILLSAAPELIWDALNDPSVLRRCIPGCSAVEKTGSNTFLTTIRAKIGPVNTRFSTQLTVLPVTPPTRYMLTGEGQGGVAGFAKGEVDIRLEEGSAGTRLQYTARIQIGGKVAQVGSRLLGTTAKKWVDQFFSAFKDAINDR